MYVEDYNTHDKDRILTINSLDGTKHYLFDSVEQKKEYEKFLKASSKLLDSIKKTINQSHTIEMNMPYEFYRKRIQIEYDCDILE